jgi:sulfoxide reductase heme-binding subunit YedZ
MLGLYAFFYACLHVLLYTFKIQGGNVNAIFRDIFGNKYLFFGMSAFILMVPLAATSTVWAIKKMGNKKWKLLHKLVYLTAICAAIHYLMTPKFVTGQKIVFACILGTLLLMRPLAWARDKWFPVKPTRAPARPAPALKSSA